MILGRFLRHAALLIAVHVGIAMLAGICLYLVVDFVEVGNLAVERGEDDLLRLSVLNLPRVARLMLPVAAPIGTLSALSGLIRRRELVAWFGAGASPATLLRPVAAVSLLAGLIFALNSELLIPPSAAAVGVLRQKIGLGQSPLEGLGRRQSWFRGTDFVYHVSSLPDPSGQRASGVMMLRLDSGRVAERWDLAELVKTTGSSWIGKDSVRRSFSGDEGLETSRDAERPVPVREAPRDFVMSVVAPERLPLLELVRTASARDRLGRPTRAHWMEAHRRLSQPLSLALVMFAAAGVAIRLGRRQTLARALGIGAILGSAMWLAGDFTTLFGLSGTLAPWVAAWVLPLSVAGGAALAWRRALAFGVAER